MPKAQPVDFVAIVERHVGDDDAADADGLQAADRGQLAGAADLDVNGFQRRFGLFRRELVGKPPARRAGD